MYDLIVGNISGVRAADNPNLNSIKAGTVTTRAQAKREGKEKPLKTPDVVQLRGLNKGDLRKMQREDVSLEKLWSVKGVIKKRNSEVEYKELNGVLYRTFTRGN